MHRGYNNSKGRGINKLLLQKNCNKIRFLWEAKKGVLISNSKQKLIARKFGLSIIHQIHCSLINIQEGVF
jgi:hypothetical protein